MLERHKHCKANPNKKRGNSFNIAMLHFGSTSPFRPLIIHKSFDQILWNPWDCFFFDTQIAQISEIRSNNKKTLKPTISFRLLKLKQMAYIRLKSNCGNIHLTILDSYRIVPLGISPRTPITQWDPTSILKGVVWEQNGNKGTTFSWGSLEFLNSNQFTSPLLFAVYTPNILPNYIGFTISHYKGPY